MIIVLKYITINKEDINFPLLTLDCSMDNFQEVIEAIKCEELYNNTEIDFDKLNYKG